MKNAVENIRLVEGTIYSWVAKGIYLSTGYIIHILLGRFLGLEDYGLFGTALATVSIFYMVLANGIPRAVSRYAAINSSNVGDVFKAGLMYQLSICAVLTLTFLVCSGFIASTVLNDLSLIPYLRLLAISFIPIGLLRLYTGALLGVHQYFKANILHGVESILRLCLVIIFVLMGWRVFGAFWAYILAAVLPLVWVHRLYDFKNTQDKHTINTRNLLAFSLPLLIFAGFSSLLLNVGILLVKGLIGADRDVGLYVAASVFANAPFALFISIRSVLMPALSHADGIKNEELVNEHMAKGLRLMVFFLVPVIALISLNAQALLLTFYGNAFSGAGIVLKILVVGVGCLALGCAFCVLFDGKGKPWIGVYFLSVTFVISITGNLVLIPKAGIIGAAIATLIAGLTLCLICGVYIFLRYGSCLPYLSISRSIFAGILSYAGGYYAMNESMQLIWILLLMCLIYMSTMIMSGELKRDEPIIQKLISFVHRHLSSKDSVE